MQLHLTCAAAMHASASGSDAAGAMHHVIVQVLCCTHASNTLLTTKILFSFQVNSFHTL
jgi:hypothetical protein